MPTCRTVYNIIVPIYICCAPVLYLLYYRIVVFMCDIVNLGTRPKTNGPERYNIVICVCIRDDVIRRKRLKSKTPTSG